MKLKLTKNGYQILECINCDQAYTNIIVSEKEVKQIYSDSYFFEGGAGYDDYTTEKNLLIKRAEYFAKKIAPFTTTGKVLDVGAACGFILKGFTNKGWTGSGIEPNGTMVHRAQHIEKMNVIQGTLENNALETKYDLVVLIQVVAHLYDLENAMTQLNKLLNPGGHVLIETWDKSSISAKFFGIDWHEYSPPGTLNFFTRNSLKTLMRQNHFSLVKEGCPKKFIHSRHARSLIKHKLSESNSLRWLAGIYKLIPKNILIRYPSEDLFWALYKKTTNNE